MSAIFNIIDINNKCFMGEIADKFPDIASPQVIYYPLLFIYDQHNTLNASEIRFQAFDLYSMPKKITAKIATIFPATTDQKDLYKENRSKIFKIGA